MELKCSPSVWELIVWVILETNKLKIQVYKNLPLQSLGGDCELSVKHAIDVGYRHFDTAYFYENEGEVGQAIRDKITEGTIKREDVFVVSKLWCHFHEPEKVEHACKLTLKNFGLDYIDCYLMHWPYAYKYRGDDVLFPTNASGKVEMKWVYCFLFRYGLRFIFLSVYEI